MTLQQIMRSSEAWESWPRRLELNPSQAGESEDAPTTPVVGWFGAGFWFGLGVLAAWIAAAAAILSLVWFATQLGLPPPLP